MSKYFFQNNRMVFNVGRQSTLEKSFIFTETCHITNESHFTISTDISKSPELPIRRYLDCQRVLCSAVKMPTYEIIKFK